MEECFEPMINRHTNQCGSKCSLQLWVSTIDHVFQLAFKEWFLLFFFYECETYGLLLTCFFFLSNFNVYRLTLSLVPHFSFKSNFPRISFEGFYTTILKRGNEIMSVVSMRYALHHLFIYDVCFWAESV